MPSGAVFLAVEAESGVAAVSAASFTLWWVSSFVLFCFFFASVFLVIFFPRDPETRRLDWRPVSPLLFCFFQLLGLRLPPSLSFSPCLSFQKSVRSFQLSLVGLLLLLSWLSCVNTVQICDDIFILVCDFFCFLLEILHILELFFIIASSSYQGLYTYYVSPKAGGVQTTPPPPLVSQKSEICLPPLPPLS